MYEYINGRLDYVCPEYISVEAGGVGYLINVPNPFAFGHKVDTNVKIYVYQHIREDFIGLYGFSTRDERKFFIKLINVTGIGPKGALAVLASGQVDQVVRAIEAEDESYLVKFPGVGKKTARQMILDLKGKLKDFTEGTGEMEVLKVADFQAKNNEHLDEAMLALQALGYSEKELAKIAKQLANETHSTEEYIKLALKLMLK
ncbi:MAG: ruvA [Bacillales bacterium]|jgi:Holliday junction DNA helicase RuvA|nr:ruvA [Bacillales bacterium]